MASAETKTPTPPYVAWGTFLNLIERMAQEGVPARVDKTYLVGMSGGTQSQIKATLRSLGLTDEDHATTDLLVRLVNESDERPVIIGEILQSKYPDLVELGAKGNTTQGQLHEAIGQYGLTADTMRKAAGFFIAAATYANLPLSPLFSPVRTTASGPRRGTRRRRGGGGQGGGAGGDDPGSQSGDATDAAMRKAYFDLLVEKAQQSDQPDADLLDRIERLVGLDEK